MKLSTPIHIPVYDNPISYDSHLWFIGSCFASNVGDKFSAIKIPTVVNPFGTLFSPHSVSEAMIRVIEKRYFTADDFFEKDGMYMSMELHSMHSYGSVSEALRVVNSLIDELHESLRKATHIFITYGTSQVYRYNPSGRLCSNCHKIPSKFFTIEQMSIDEIYDGAMRVERLLAEINKGASLYYTVSPVRYMGDGALRSSVIKSKLFCAIERIVSDSTMADYFPSYEIVMDELRDYRYYGEDMIHPSGVAVDYIWEKIQGAFFNASTVSFSQRVTSVVSAAAHRPKNPDSEQYRLFCKKNLDEIAAICDMYPTLDMEKEKEFFMSKL